MRLRNVKHAKETIEKHPEIVIAEPKKYKGCWHDLFHNDHPIHLEIGSGKGQFIYEIAKKHPNINYIGIEKFDSVIIRALEKIIENPLPNVLLLRIDAEKITDVFAKDEIKKIYLNFSDPWPKRRTAKRRLTSTTFIERYKKITEEGSEIAFKTDNFKLFEFSIMEFNRSNDCRIDCINLNLYRHLPKDNIQTEFEQKFVEKGNLIFFMKVRFTKEKS